MVLICLMRYRKLQKKFSLVIIPTTIHMFSNQMLSKKEKSKSLLKLVSFLLITLKKQLLMLFIVQVTYAHLISSAPNIEIF